MTLPSGGAIYVDGPAGAVPVLFLHGIGGGAWSWRPQRDALANIARTYVWEARGHGDTPRVADASIADFLIDAKEALGVIVRDERRPTIVVGHSLGGLLALALASEAGAAVAGLFLVDPLIYSGGGWLGVFHRFGRVATTLTAPVFGTFGRNGAVARRIVRLAFERGFEDRVRMEEAWPDQAGQIPAEYTTVLRETFGGPRSIVARDYAAEIADPTYLIEGTTARRKPHFPAFVTAMQGKLGDHFVYETIPGGHYLQLDQPDAVNVRLRTFVQKYAA